MASGRHFLFRSVELGLLTALAACGPSYSPNTYSSQAVQQANKVEQGIVVGVRRVGVSASGTVGTVTGGAAGGIAGAQVPGGGVSEAFGALGGAVVGGVVGSTIEHTAGDSQAFEYIVRKTNGDLLSVTQQDRQPLALGEKVLVITGKQARVVHDYTVAIEPPAPAKPQQAAAGGAPEHPGQATSLAPAPAPVSQTPLPPPPKPADATATPSAPTPASAQAAAPAASPPPASAPAPPAPAQATPP
ncbi:MAG: glycine zipper 2TM domain-containing protein [Acidisphaera sp.]|nr:glycine zipper 2TM domain-containing protein [Acidisphaera sp.]